MVGDDASGGLFIVISVAGESLESSPGMSPSFLPACSLCAAYLLGTQIGESLIYL